MALLVMGLGVAGVAALVPIAVLRGVEATKLTHATLLRQNAEARIRSSVSRAEDFNPPGTTSSAYPPIIRAFVDDPNRNYDPGEHRPSPLGYAPDSVLKYVVDPLGAMIMGGTVAEPGDGNIPKVGTDRTVTLLKPNVPPVLPSFNATTFPNGMGGSLPRFTFGLNSITAAQNFVTLPDSFITVADVIGSALTVSGSGPPYTVTIPEVDLSEFNAAQGVRVTVFHASARASVALEGTIQSATTVQTNDVIPGAYAGNVGRVTVEVPERRYTWLATVRHFGPQPSVTIVVFFRRAFSPLDETTYGVTEPAGTFNEFTFTGPTAAGEDRPEGLKPGGFMFDLGAFRWLKIVKVEDPVAGVIRFKTDASEVDPSIGGRSFQAMFPRNVVEAYPLKKD